MSSQEQSQQQDTVFILFLALMLGQLLKMLSKHTKIPYTPLLTIVGLIIGLINASSDAFGTYKAPLHSWATIKPYIILFLFLPALIFESAYASDWHIFRMQFSSVFYLAGPLLLLSTFLSAVIMRYILGYDGTFTFEAAVLFGAIISATDPVAVVSLLKELGASRKLATLIEGESLFNDGTAYVVFLVLVKMVEGQQLTAGGIIILFLRLSVGGLLLGLVVGVFSSQVLKRIFNDSVLEVNTTLVVAYTVFYIAEGTALHVSGILALVALGLYMSRSGKNSISNSSEASVHHVWQTIQFSCETLIFLLSGLIIGETLVQSQYISLKDYFLLPCLFVLLLILRFMLLMGSLPLLRRFGYGTTPQEAAVMAYGGLRGAVGLCLALLVKENPKIDDKVKDIIMFHTGGIALLTLMVNALTIKYLVNWLGMSRMSDQLMDIMDGMVVHMDAHVQHSIEDMKQHHHHFNQVNWQQVKEEVNLKTLHDKLSRINQQIKKVKSKGRRSVYMPQPLGGISQQLAINIQLAQQGDEDRKEDTPVKQECSRAVEGVRLRRTALLGEDIPEPIELSPEEQHFLMVIRHKYLVILKSLYQEFYEKGQCQQDSLFILQETCSQQMDQEQDHLKDSEFLLKYISSFMKFRLYNIFKNTPVVGKAVKGMLFNNLSVCYDILLNYLEGHEEAFKVLDEVISDAHIRSILKKESDAQIAIVQGFMRKQFEGKLEEVTQAIQQRRATYQVIYHQYAFVHSLVQKGQIESQEADLFILHLDKNMHHLKNNPPPIRMADFKEKIVFYSELSQIFNIEELQTVCDNAQLQFVEAGEQVQVQKEQMAYVHKGVLLESMDSHEPAKVQTGQVGMMHLLFPELKMHTVLTAQKDGLARYAAIDTNYLKIILDQNEQRQEKLWKHLAHKIIFLNLSLNSSLEPLREYSQKELRVLCREWDLSMYNAQEVLQMPAGGILLQGSLINVSLISPSRLQKLLSQPVTQQGRLMSKNSTVSKHSRQDSNGQEFPDSISSIMLIKACSEDFLTLEPCVIMHFNRDFLKGSQVDQPKVGHNLDVQVGRIKSTQIFRANSIGLRSRNSIVMTSNLRKTIVEDTNIKRRSSLMMSRTGKWQPSIPLREWVDGNRNEIKEVEEKEERMRE